MPTPSTKSYTHRILSVTASWFNWTKLYVIPKRNVLGSVLEYYLFSHQKTDLFNTNLPLGFQNEINKLVTLSVWMERRWNNWNAGAYLIRPACVGCSAFPACNVSALVPPRHASLFVPAGAFIRRYGLLIQHTQSTARVQISVFLNSD